MIRLKFKITSIVAKFGLASYMFLMLSNSSIAGEFHQLDRTSEDSLKIIGLLEEAKQEVAGDYKKAITLTLEAKKIAQNMDKPKLLMVTELSLGMFYFYMGLYEQALSSYINSIRLAEATQDFENLGKGYSQLSGIRLVMEDYDQAEIHLFKAKDYYIKYFGKEEEMNLSLRAVIHNNLGLIYIGKQKNELARKEFESGLELLAKSPNVYSARVQLLNNLGDLNLKEGRITEALEYYSLAKTYLDDIPNLLFEAMLDNSMGKAYTELELYAEAIKYFSDGITTAKQADGFSHY